jgi:lipocalin
MKQALIFLFMMNLFSCKAPQDLPTVKFVDLKKYTGTWYEIARLPNRFEKGLTCISATYTLKENGEIKVLNQGHLLENTSEKSQATGKAWIPDSNYPGRLKVQFFWPFAGDYYIIHLDDDYQYVLVGSPNRKFLWVLSKTKQLEETIYSKLLKIAEEQGFEVSTIIKVNHDCD